MSASATRIAALRRRTPTNIDSYKVVPVPECRIAAVNMSPPDAYGGAIIPLIPGSMSVQRQVYLSHVVLKVEVRIVDPVRVVKTQRSGDESLTQDWRLR